MTKIIFHDIPYTDDSKIICPHCGIEIIGRKEIGKQYSCAQTYEFDISVACESKYEPCNSQIIDFNI